MVFHYNHSQAPDRPECSLDIVNPMESEKLVKKVLAFPDTGADMTMIPQECIPNLGNLIRGQPIQFRGVNGIRTLQTYIVDIRISGYTFPSLEVVAIPKNHVLIGRDILNENKAVFDANQDFWILNCGESCPSI